MRVHILDLDFQNIPGLIASYLLEGGDGWVMVETGPESCRAALLERLEGLGVKPEDVAAVFVTHIHLDHSGGAWWWAQRGVPVHVHPRGVRHLVEPEKLIASARQVYGERFEGLWGETGAAPADGVRPVEDGERLAFAGLEIEAVETPGHAFHHHGYRVEDRFFAGDALGARVAEQDYLSVTSAPPQFHLGHTLDSLEKIRGLGVSTLYPTHFGPVPEVEAHLDAYREAVELSAAFVRDRLREGMDEEALRVAYEALQLEQAFRADLPRERWEAFQAINGTDICADGIRMFWEREEGGT